IRNEPEYIFIRSEVQKEFYKWLDSTGITAENKGGGGKFEQETREYTKKLENSYQHDDFSDIFRQTQKENFHFYADNYYQQRVSEEPEENPEEITEEIKAYRATAETELKELMKEK
ncbi:5136_t:CDS:2, partial [Funneliformis geosporum]